MSNFKKIFTLLNAKQFLRSKNYLTGISLIIIAGLVIGGVFYFKMESQKAKGAISTEGLVLWLKMDDNLATTNVIDSSVEGNHGTFSDAGGDPNTNAHSEVSLHQRALTFDGDNDYVDCGAIGGIANSFTFSAWFKTQNIDVAQRIVSYRPAAGDANEIRLGLYDGAVNEKTLYGFVADSSGSGSGTNKKYGGNTIIQNDVWYFGTVTWDGTNLDVYLNGIKDIPYTVNTDGLVMMTDTIRNRQIGTVEHIYDNFNGSIDQVRIYNRALTAEEIALHYFLGSETRLKNTVIKNAVIR